MRDIRVVLGIVIYYPSEKELDRIIQYSKKFNHIYVYDNTEGEMQISNSIKLKESKTIRYFCDNTNVGLAKAYNNMCKRAILEKFDFIILFDQDSILSNRELSEYIDYIRLCDIDRVGLFTPEVIDLNKNIKKNEDINEVYSQVEWAISSGSAINLDVYKLTDGFDENYFIDRIDFDYCMQLKEKEYKNIKINTVKLKHRIGDEHKFIFLKISQHNSTRHYYMFRNRLYYYLIKNPTKENKKKAIVNSIFHVIRVLMESDSKEKINSILRGYIDFKNNNMGKKTN